MPPMLPTPIMPSCGGCEICRSTGVKLMEVSYLFDLHVD